MSGRSRFPQINPRGLHLIVVAGLAASATVGPILTAPRRAQAQEDAPVIREIEFEGLKRVEAAAVSIVLANRTGKPLRREAVADDIRAVYGTGYFSNVQLYKEDVEGGIKLIYVLTEKPAIRRVVYEGNDDISTDDIKEVVDLRPFTILSDSKVKKNVQKIQDLYNEKGFYLAEVDYEIRPTADNQVEVVFKMLENAKVEVRTIRFVGNRNLPDSLLKTGLITQEGNLLSFLTQAGTYRKDAFQVDMFRIQSHYFDNGYINVKIDTPDVEISPDRKYIYITIRIVEGEQYSVGSIGFSGDTPDSGIDLADLVLIKEGEVFNRSQLQTDLGRLKKRFEDEGYAYANIAPLTSINADERTIKLSFEVDKGEKVYYERINIVGNSKTRDKVIRRELRIYEGELTSASLREFSQQRVMALGFFESVDIKTRRGSADNLQIADVEIKEKATGTFQIGAGFSSAENFIATAQIAQQNFLGRGQTISLSAQLSSLRQLFQLQFSEPYLFDSRWTLNLNIFNTQTQFRSFQRTATGGSITVGRPLPLVADFFRVFLTYSLEFVQSEPNAGLFDQPALASLNNRGRISSLRATLSYDSRNNRLFPTNGMFHQLSAELSAPAFGATENRAFQRYRWNSRFYRPLFWRFVGRVSLRAGFLQSDAEQGLSPSEKFVLGGIQSLRGYLPFTIGPERRATLNDQGVERLDPFSRSFAFVEGGNKEFLANFEIEFPIFQQVGIKGVLFLDAGNVYGEEENFFYLGNTFREPQRLPDDPSLFRPQTLPLGLFWSVGFGFRWFSPIGPLRFEWGIPLTRRPTDPDGPLFEFSIGNSF